MTPAEAYELDDDTYRAFVGFMRDEAREARARAKRR